MIVSNTVVIWLCGLFFISHFKRLSRGSYRDKRSSFKSQCFQPIHGFGLQFNDEKNASSKSVFN